MATEKRKTRKTTKRKNGRGVDGVADVIATAKQKAQNANPLAIKIILGAGAVGVVFFVGRKIIKNIKANRLENEALRQIAQKAANAAPTATITQGDAITIAASLKAAMSPIGTDEATIDRLMSRITNGSDMWLVIHAFGEQPYRFGGYSTASSAQKLNLIGWFREELSGGRLKEIENKLAEWGIAL